jgi:hypothetical protein
VITQGLNPEHRCWRTTRLHNPIIASDLATKKRHKKRSIWHECEHIARQSTTFSNAETVIIPTPITSDLTSSQLYYWQYYQSPLLPPQVLSPLASLLRYHPLASPPPPHHHQLRYLLAPRQSTGPSPHPSPSWAIRKIPIRSPTFKQYGPAIKMTT